MCPTSLNESFDGTRAYNLYLDDTFFADAFPVKMTVKGLTRETALTQSLNTANGGWNLLSNGFTRVLNWEALDKTALENTYYVWDAKNQNYATYQEGGSATFDATQYIAPYQSVFVRMGAAQGAGTSSQFINFETKPEEAKVVCGATAINPFYKKGDDVIKLSTSTTANDYRDELILNFSDDYHDDFEKQEDVTKFFSRELSVPTIYAVVEDEACVIAGYPKVNEFIQNIPLGYRTEIGENVTITMDTVQPGVKVILEDKALGIFHNMKEPYHFTASDGANASRLLLHFGDQSNTNWPFVTSTWNDFYVYKNHDLLQFAKNEKLIGQTVEIYNTSGLLVDEFILDESFTHPVPPAASGMFIIKTANRTRSKTFIQKIFF
jgi:hypothetical protein